MARKGEVPFRRRGCGLRAARVPEVQPCSGYRNHTDIRSMGDGRWAMVDGDGRWRWSMGWQWRGGDGDGDGDSDA
eukprot:15441371-Alexandrium_andersonii.AAC.1